MVKKGTIPIVPAANRTLTVHSLSITDWATLGNTELITMSAFEHTALIMYNSIFWDKIPCSPLKVNLCFEEVFSLHLQGRRIVQARPVWKQVPSKAGLKTLWLSAKFVQLLAFAFHLLSHWFLAWLILRPWRWRQFLRTVSWPSRNYKVLYLRQHMKCNLKAHYNFTTKRTHFSIETWPVGILFPLDL
jgi:hypothetical protein